ncbi:MAG: enoyl-CoA hydratase/isomerase family protein, partial [Pseudomonadota bacterium]|nr:enoyl-CoA hydratase/isomerase family protein [Pseudomonadota bacterium]
MSDLLIDVTDGIATLTMNRPDARNALSLEMRGGMHTFLDEHENDDSVRCVVIKGAGEHFMAGGDVKSFAHMAQEQEPDELRRHFRGLQVLHVVHVGPVILGGAFRVAIEQLRHAPIA